MLTRMGGTVVLLGIVGFLVAGGATAGEWPHERDGIVLGLNVGGGTASVDIPGVDTDREGGFAGNLRATYAFNPEIAAGFEGNLWKKEVDNETWTFGVSGLALSYYPGAKGFFVRGGVGVGTVEFKYETEGTTYSVSDDGFGFLLATGYEWRLTRRFALGPQVDFAHAKVNDDLSFNFVNFTVGLNWYF